MAKPRKPVQPKRKVPRITWPVVGAIAAVVFVLVIGSFGFAATKEENNAFCASCHTQPETTYYERFQSGQVNTLSTFHNTKEVKCIDCHSGSGVGGRVSAILLGSRNAVAYLTHTAKQPAPLTVPIGDSNCLKCHTETMTRQGFDNHYHEFLARWQSVDVNAAGCVDCHSSHTTNGDQKIQFLNQTQTEQVCTACHNAIAE